MNLREKYIKRIKEIQGRAVGFRIDQVQLPNGHVANREYLNHPGAVAVLPIVAPGRIIMVRQFRHPVGEITLEIPAGKLDKGEMPLTCVKRELEEETGYKAGRIKKLLSFWPTAAFANEVIHVYVADKLFKGRFNPDEDEFLSCKVYSLKTLLRSIQQGKIKDSKTIIALLAYKNILRP
ncbi:MAG: Methanol dehydrogenase activator [Elusimicrobia bacterium]|nr:Methanol dehydrogenase activator [Elusimicrobiota bacterium]